MRWKFYTGSSRWGTLRKGEPLLEIETDKVNMEIEAPDSGQLIEVRVKEGDVVVFNSIVAIIESEG